MDQGPTAKLAYTEQAINPRLPLTGTGEGSKTEEGGNRFVRDPGTGSRTGTAGRSLATTTAPAGPERHWRKRWGPSAGDGLGNRGTIRGLPVCRDREHGGTQAVSRRSGSPREPRSEGPKVLLSFLGRTHTGEEAPGHNL